MEENSKALINEMQIDVSQNGPIEESKYKTIVNMIDEVIEDGLKVKGNHLEYDNRLSIDGAVNHLADTFIQMKDIMDRVAIEDPWHTKAFGEEVENALITMAAIKAFGIGKKSERYLGVVKKVVRELNTAPSKG